MTNHEVIVPQATMTEIIKLDEAARAAHRQLIEASMAGNEMAKGLIMARAIQVLRGLLTKAIMADVMQLQNNSLGFKTDKPDGYSEPVVRDVMVQAMLKGVRPTGNELNIIAAQLYITKEGYERLLKELPGVGGLRVDVGVPKTVGDKGAICPARAKWTVHGEPAELVCEGDYAIPIRVNSGMGTDAIQGKATSKMYRRIYKIITNMEIDGDEDESPGDDPNTIDGSAQRVTTDKEPYREAS
jgi:hypothetical protein